MEKTQVKMIAFTKITNISAIFFLAIALVLPVKAYGETEQVENDKARLKLLRRTANISLWRLKVVIERDGFYSARSALNIWRSNAKDAGTFDQSKFDEFKKQIYEKSVNSNLKCIEKCLMNENYTDAKICLYWWETHSQVLNTFDPVKHDELKKLIEEGREKKKQLIETNQKSTE
ncbi:MAG: hypothetical protein JRJ76_14590 [Deltaproteobacteria bacterium]|nr:hypothetical protein [Deltaproteobacteria bacterium]